MKLLQTSLILLSVGLSVSSPPNLAELSLAAGEDQGKEELVDHNVGPIVTEDQDLQQHQLDQTTPKSSSEVEASLFNHPACKADIEAALVSRSCHPVEHYKQSNYALIACLTNSPTQDGKSGLSERCEHVLWEYQVQLTNNADFLKEISNACPENLQDFEECIRDRRRQRKPRKKSSVFKETAEILTCAVELKNDPTKHFLDSCLLRLTQIETVILSDYRLVGNFIEGCYDDIQREGCGRLQGSSEAHSSQGKVLECLMNHLPNLTKTCENQLLKVAEYQGEDYHLDRRLFLACKKDRQHLCGKVKAGQGRVYDCLISNKDNPEMSKRCRTQVTRRQKMIAEDFKISKGLAIGCGREIEAYKCAEVHPKDHETIQLTQVLLCLEDVMKNDEGPIESTCLIEMRAHRRMLMQDYNISPELTVACKLEIQSDCVNAGIGGETIHCLMGLAASHKLKSEHCEAQLQLLMKKVDLASDWQVDPVLQRTCQEVVVEACDSVVGSEGIMACLMNLLATNSHHMTQECGKTLMEVQYFLARDFSLNPKLYKKCRKDAARMCNAASDWHKQQQDDHDSKLVFMCLVRNLYVEPEMDHNRQMISPVGLSSDCAEQVEKTLEMRSVSVNLQPEIEEACRGYLVANCAEHIHPGQEMQCLQDMFELLRDECREVVEAYSKLESRNIFLNNVVATSCFDLIEKECKQEADKIDEGKVMHCLIEFKSEHNEDIDEKCAAAVEHWQIFTLKDWKFSASFKKSCADDVRGLCQPTPKSKAEVLTCLSQEIQKNYLENAPQAVSERCRKELKFELLQQHSDIKLNKAMKTACEQELDTFCSQSKSLECLRGIPHPKLGSKCKFLLFKEEQEEVIMNEVDPVLMRRCANEIRSHCSEKEVSPNGILRCLEEHKDENNFDPKCKAVIVRRIVQDMSDYRLNPRLQKACAHDLPKFCSQVIANHRNSEKEFLEGEVIGCLKLEFIKNSERLTEDCRDEVEHLIKQTSVDINSNPRLVRACPNSISFCKTSTHSKDIDAGGDEGRVEECLKDLFRNKTLGHHNDPPECIIEVSKVIEAASLNIRVDHVLFEACGVDLAKFCRDVEPGQGRQISCLRNVMEDKRLKLEHRCEMILTKRLELYDRAIREFPVRSVQDLYHQISSSPDRHYFLLLFMTCIGAIFLGGLFCGRVTKRVRREMKNK